ncbi:sulfatase-like hydrolase/transferase [Devosia rhodophyticola]|uniref:Sulfatase-like hydrolase/transferase n=1 Tax=Devosia rhodophyticola TaxID=3026423 RepID=A0ABY7YV35_9HYPH|nr:sulfatase-like hydrolase/transferase [Devosia rhodophyticola]WDR05228.1 sulfatase-like hydrolase/transferase [Devosia rhodophyticola]
MPRQPNFIFIIADDHRFESLGFNCSEVETPNLDRLAKSGVVFDNAHCQGSLHPAVCVPSRASLMTGRNIFALRGGSAHEPTIGIPEDFDTFPQLLAGAGYKTHAVGKWHNDFGSFTRSFVSGDRIFFGGMSDHDKVPLHDFDPAGKYGSTEPRLEAGLSTDMFEQSAKSFLENVGTDDPFCLYIAFTAPHDPRTPPDGFKVDPSSVSLPDNFMPIHPFDNGATVLRDELLEAMPRTPEAVRQHLADYYGMIKHLDNAIGNILETAERAGALDNTVVVYTADHGLALGQHGLMGKQNVYEHSLHIPLIIAGPGVKGGQKLSPLVWHADTRATVLDLAGLQTEANSDGGSLMPLINGNGDVPRETFGAAYRMGQRMIRNERYKLIRYYQSGTHDKDELPGLPTPTLGSALEQIFDLESDPGETINLAFVPEMQDVRAQLSAALDAWQTQVGDPLARKDAS